MNNTSTHVTDGKQNWSINFTNNQKIGKTTKYPDLIEKTKSNTATDWAMIKTRFVDKAHCLNMIKTKEFGKIDLTRIK